MNDGHVTIAKLTDGRLVEYDACGKRDDYAPKNFSFIGEGIIHSVDGIVQTVDQVQFCFFSRLF